MQNPQLTQYIQTQRTAGVSDDAIKQELLSSGWGAGDIDIAFGTFSPQAGEATPEKSSSTWKYIVIAFGLFLMLVVGSFAMMLSDTQDTNIPSVGAYSNDEQIQNNVGSSDETSHIHTDEQSDNVSTNNDTHDPSVPFDPNDMSTWGTAERYNADGQPVLFRKELPNGVTGETLVNWASE
mgnify:CR=1 FL=1